MAKLIENENEMHNVDREDSILKEEFEKILRLLKANKAPVVHLIAAELLLDSVQADKIILFIIICDMYKTDDKKILQG